MKTSLRPCPICGSQTADVLHQQSFVLPEGHPLSRGYDVVSCSGCGFVFADTVVSQEDYDRFYAQFSKYEDGLTSTGAGETPEDAQRLREVAQWIAVTVPDRNAVIADIGCANGGLLEALKESGFHHLVGIDPSPACVQNTRKRSGIRAFQGGLGQMPDAGAFDVIILSHVLEHIRDLRVALESVTAALTPDGLLYAEVPDATRYKDCLVCPFQDFNTEHINHFSLKSLSALLAEAGFASVKTGAKTLFAGSSLEYPAIFGIWKPVTKMAGTSVRQFDFDKQLKESVVDYIALSAAMLDQLERHLALALAGDGEVIVWGTGQLTMKLLAYTSLGKAKIAAFVDGNPAQHGKILQGVRIRAPEEIRRLKCPIVVASLLHEAAIANRIQREMGLPNEIIRLGGMRRVSHNLRAEMPQ